MSLEPGRYHILNAGSLEPINIVCRQVGEEPTICTWKVQNSPSEKWIIERGMSGGYHIRNEATDLYISFPESATRPMANDKVVGNSSPIEWEIFSVGFVYRISLLMNPSLDIVVNMASKFEGKEVIFRDDSIRPSGSTTKGQQPEVNEDSMWVFVKDTSEEPPSYRRNAYIGPVPSGLYWLGQADGKAQIASAAAKLPAVGALTVTSRSLLHNQATAPLHLSAISDGPWPNQIWMIEAGTRGYRLRNIGTNTYLTLVNREAVAEPSSPGSSPTEWCIKLYPKRQPSDFQSYTLAPLTDLNSSLTTEFGNLFYKVEVKQPSWWHAMSCVEWRLCSVDAELLRPPEIHL